MDHKAFGHPQDSDLAHRRPGYVEITESDVSKFKQHTASSIHEAVNVLAATAKRVADGTMSNARLAELEKAYGLNFNPLGLIADAGLRRPFN